MNVKKRIAIGLRICLLIVIIGLISYRGVMLLRRPPLNLSELIRNENIDDLSLTIYYKPPALVSMPISVKGLINSDWGGARIIIRVDDLEEYIDLFKQINRSHLNPVWWRAPNVDVRLYYVLESKQNGRLLEVAAWCLGSSMYVNGFEVRANTIFYEVILPFMPEDVARDFERWFELGR